MRILIDTNIYLHAIDQTQNREKGKACSQIFDLIQADHITSVYNTIVVAELHFNLNNYYRLLPKQIHTYLEAYFLKKGSFESRQFQIPLSIQIMKSCSLDFPDALIAQNALSEGIPVLSYDKDFDRVEGLTRLEPKTLIRKFS